MKLLLVVVDNGVVRVVVVLTAVIRAALCAAGCLAGIKARALRAASRLIHLLGHLVERLGQLLGRGLDGRGVGAGEGALERGELCLNVALVGGVELVAHLAEGLLGLVDHLVALVADVDLFLALCVLCRVHLGLLDGLVDVLLGHVGGGGDGDVLLLAGAEILCGDVDDAVCVYIKGDFDLRNAAACRGDAVQMEAAEALVVSGHLALALQDVDLNGGLVVGCGGDANARIIIELTS